jgi:hypothetical protein
MILARSVAGGAALAVAAAMTPVALGQIDAQFPTLVQVQVRPTPPAEVPNQPNVSRQRQTPVPSRRPVAHSNAVDATQRGCLTPEEFKEIPSMDGDTDRNLKWLQSPELCVSYDVFQEGGLTWVLHIIQNEKKRKGPLWAVPHDNENGAFDTAVQAVLEFGGAVVAVKTSGQRFNGQQDPNRNFDAGTNMKCEQQVAASPEYTRRFLRWKAPQQPIIALHTNEQGHNTDGRGGRGSISIDRVEKNNFPFRAANPIGSSPSDTLIFVASIEPPPAHPKLEQFVNDLRANGVHVIYETVSGTRNDCSLSNYAALTASKTGSAYIGDYFNIEVVHNDAQTQLDIVKRIMALLKTHGAVGPPPPPGPPNSAGLPQSAPGAAKPEPLAAPGPGTEPAPAAAQGAPPAIGPPVQINPAAQQNR